MFAVVAFFAFLVYLTHARPTGVVYDWNLRQSERAQHITKTLPHTYLEVRTETSLTKLSGFLSVRLGVVLGVYNVFVNSAIRFGLEKVLRPFLHRKRISFDSVVECVRSGSPFSSIIIK